MNRTALPAAVLLLPAALLLASPPAAALGSRLAEKAVEDTQVGYSIQPVRGWEPTPRKNPDDPFARAQVGGWYAKDDPERDPSCTVFAFGSYFPREGDRRVATGGEESPGKPDEGEGDEGEGAEKPEKKAAPKTLEEKFGKGPESFEAYLAEFQKRVEKQKWSFRMRDVKARFGDDEGLLYEGKMTWGSGSNQVAYNLVASSIKRPGFEVAAFYMVKDDKYYVRDYRGTLLASVKSLRVLPEREMRKAREALERRIAEAGNENAAWVERVLANLPPGWTSHRTDNYVIVYDRTIDAPPPIGRQGLIPRIGRQLEALRRDIYEPLFPAEEPVTAISIVKVTQDPQQYAAYGAPQGSAGYWSWPSRELVFFCKADAALDVTLPVLNHEAFHQYIFYAVGQVSPHSWFNEGHGDYFAGFSLNRGRFRPEKFEWRQETIRRAIEGGTHVPLRKFLSFSQREYYGGGEGKGPAEGRDVRQNYAQGWSLVWFLRTTGNEAYREILDRYFTSLKGAVTRWKREEEAAAAKEGRPPLATWQFPDEENEKAMKEALEAAFAGIDIDQLERDWIASKPY